VDGATHINGSKPPTPSPKPSPKPSPTPPPAECIHADPTVTISPVAQWGYRGGLLTYQVQVKNNDSAGCENTQLAFALRTPSQAYGGFSSSFIVSAPGETSLNLVQLRIRKKAPRRTYSFAVTAYNAYMPQVQGSALGMFVVN